MPLPLSWALWATAWDHSSDTGGVLGDVSPPNLRPPLAAQADSDEVPTGRVDEDAPVMLVGPLECDEKCGGRRTWAGLGVLKDEAPIFPTVVTVVMEAMPTSSSPWVLWFKLEPPGSPLILLSALPSPTSVLAFSLLLRAQLLEWCRDNSVIWENLVRENTTHYTVEYTCKAVLVVSYHALGCKRTCISGNRSLVFIRKGLFILVCM